MSFVHRRELRAVTDAELLEAVERVDAGHRLAFPELAAQIETSQTGPR